MSETAYYEPQGLAQTIFKKRYAFTADETWQDACRRVAQHVAKAETPEKQETHSAEFFELLAKNYFMPGGRIWYGSGRPKGQLLNCVAGETLVHTRQGLRPAYTLADQEVDVLTEGGHFRKAKWYCYGEQPLYKIILRNGDELFATAAHEWVTIPNDQRLSKTQRVTTTQLAGKTIPFQSAKEFVYDEVEFKRGVRHGIVYGDGSLYMNGKYASVRLFDEKRTYATKYFADIACHMAIREYDYSSFTEVQHLDSTLKQLPDMSRSMSYLRGFLAGWIGTDGCVDNRGVVMAHSSKFDDLVAIRRIAAHVGLATTSLKKARDRNPWTGVEAPNWKLIFSRFGIDQHLLIKPTHRANFEKNPLSKKRPSVRVVSVEATSRLEKVFCCVEPETHTMVIDAGYLTGQCFVVPTDDSREGWGKTTSDMIIVTGQGGGLGINFSPIRPRGSSINGSGGTATGAVSLMEIINAAGNVIKAGGGRRVALMFCLGLTHGDLGEFLDKKLNLKELTNANVSVWFDDDPEAFFDKVKKGEEFQFKFRGKIIGSVPAKDIWDKIIANALKSGEPGMLNGYYANRMSNIWYYKKLISTNPCGEIVLIENDCCCLGAVVLPRFVVKKDLDWDLLKHTVRTSVRFLDDVLSVNNYPLPEIAETCKNIRRIGAGVIGLHDMLLRLGLKYSSDAGLEMADKVMKFIKETAYEASIDLAIEKGAFPKFDPELFLKSGFTKTLRPSIRSRIREHGIRNCALLTIAPTGTTAMVCAATSGIEPMYSPAYERRYRDGDELKVEVVVHPLLKEFIKDGRSTKHFQGAYDLKLRDHFEMQRTCQRHVDNAVSKTINLKPGTDAEELSDLCIEFFPELKGVTVYPEGSREDQPLTPLPYDKAIAAASDELVTEMAYSTDCPGGACDV